MMALKRNVFLLCRAFCPIYPFLYRRMPHLSKFAPHCQNAFSRNLTHPLRCRLEWAELADGGHHVFRVVPADELRLDGA